MGEAFDVVIVENSASPASCDFIARFRSTLSHCKVQILLNSKRVPWMDGFLDALTGDFHFAHSNSAKPSPQLLQEAVLSVAAKGVNRIRYEVVDNQGDLVSTADADLFVWEVTDKVFVSDIDGTITRSNLHGILNTVVTDNFRKDASTLHGGVCKFYERLLKGKQTTTPRVAYLTSRPLEIAAKTRRFLATVAQDGVKLPPGPLLGHPGTLMDVLNSELFKRDIHRHKADRLMRCLRLVFAAAGASADKCPLVGAIGNNLTDTTAYEMGGIPLDHIYIIDTTSRIRCFDNRTQGSEPKNGRSKHGGASPMRPIRSHQSYRRLMNSTFQGYDDPSFLDHVRNNQA